MTTKVLAILLTAHQAASQDYSVVPKWADFGFYGDLGFQELDYKLEFIMEHYEIVSIEKCTGNGGGSTVRMSRLAMFAVKLETKVKRRFARISQSWRRPLLGPSPG